MYLFCRHRVWPVEIAINAGGSSVISNQKKKTIVLEKPKSNSLKDQINSKPKTPKIEIKHYIAFFDLGDLLYPGSKFNCDRACNRRPKHNVGKKKIK